MATTHIEEVSAFYKVFGDATRLCILQTLLTGKKNVGELVNILEMSQSAISHQLQILRLHNLVKTEKMGKVVFYELSDDHIKIILKYGFEHIKEKEHL